MFETCGEQMMCREESSEVGSRQVKQLWEMMLGFASLGCCCFPLLSTVMATAALTDNDAHTAPDSARTAQTEPFKRWWEISLQSFIPMQALGTTLKLLEDDSWCCLFLQTEETQCRSLAKLINFRVVVMNFSLRESFNSTKYSSFSDTDLNVEPVNIWFICMYLWKVHTDKPNIIGLFHILLLRGVTPWYYQTGDLQILFFKLLLSQYIAELTVSEFIVQ